MTPMAPPPMSCCCLLRPLLLFEEGRGPAAEEHPSWQKLTETIRNRHGHAPVPLFPYKEVQRRKGRHAWMGYAEGQEAHG